MRFGGAISSAARHARGRAATLFAFAALLAMPHLPLARAASGTWLGTVDASWANAGNWSAAPVPGSGDMATFSNAGSPFDTIDLGTGVTLGAILFDTAAADPYVIGAGGSNAQTLTLNNGGTITVNATVANGETINAAIVLGTDATAQAYTLTNNSVAATLAVAGSVGGGSGGTAGVKTLNVAGAGATSLSGIIGNGGAGSVGITKTGAGTLTLWGANTFSGAVALNGGTLKAGIASVTNTSGAFGRNSAVTLANTAGVLLDISGFDTQIGSLAGGGASGGNVSLGSNTLTVGGNNANTTFAGVISSGPGFSGVSLNKIGTGQLQLDRANTFTGKIVIDTGKLYATEANGSLADAKLGAVPSSFVADSITIRNGGTLNLASGTDGRSLAANRGIYLDGTGINYINTGSGDFYVNGVISGPGSLGHANLSGGYRRLYLTGANTFTGDTYWNASGSTGNYGGIEMAGQPLALQNSAVRADSVASWLGISTTAGVLQLGGLVDGTGTVRSLASLTNNGTFTGLVLNPTVPGVVKSYSGVIGGTNEANTTLTKTGAGIQELKGASTFTGATTVKAGELRINSIKAIGGAANALGQPTTVANGTISIGDGATTATLTYNGTGDTTDRVINLAGTSGGAVLDMSGTNTLTFSGSVTATGVGAKTLTLQGSTTGSGLIGGQIFDSSGGVTSLTKTGSGTWTLGGANTYGGDTTLVAGTLTLGTNLAIQNSALNCSGGTLAFSPGVTTPTFGGLSGGTGLSLPAPVTGLTLNVGAGLTKTYAGTLGSDGTGMTLTKSGAGAQILGSTTFAGGTSVDAGKLYLNGTSTTSAIAVAAGATLGGTGSATAATATIAGGGLLEAGAGGQGTLTLGGLAFAAAGRITVTDIGNYAAGPAIRVLNSNGLATGGGPGSVTFALRGSAPAGGTVHLLDYSGSIGGSGFAGFGLDTSGLSAGPRALFTLTDNPGSVGLSFSVDKPVWTGAGSGEWVTSPSLAVTPPANWTLASNAATPTTFIAGDAAVFDDTAAITTVTIGAADVSPASVTFNNNYRDYVLQGGFAITGGTGLTKAGYGRLVVTTNNTYTGGTTIDGSVVQVGDGGTTGALGTGPIANGGLLEFNRADAIAVAGAITGSGGLTQNGTGTLLLSGANAYGGDTTLNAGTLRLGNATALGGSSGTLVINGGTLDSAVPGLVLTNNNAQSWNADVVFAGSNDLNLGTGPVSLGSDPFLPRGVTVVAGTLTVGGVMSDGGYAGLVKAGAGTLVLGGANTYAGTTLNAGTITVGDGGSLGAATGPLVINNLSPDDGTAVVLNVNGSVGVGSLSGTIGTPYRGVNTATIAIAATKALTVNQAVDDTYYGLVTGAGKFVKSGPASLTLTGVNTYSGGTTLAQGILSVDRLNNNSAAGLSNLGNSGPIMVTGGTLRYTGGASVTSDRFLLTSGNPTIEITRSTAALTVTSQFGSATITKTGAGTLTLGGNVYYTGNLGEISVSVNEGTMVLASTVTDPAFTDTVANVVDVQPGAILRLGATGTNVGRQVRPENSFHMSGGTYDLNGNGTTFGPQIDGSGWILTGAAGSAVLGVYPSANKTFSGNIVDGNGTVGVRLANRIGNNTYASLSAATWTLSGVNTYGGATVVDSGTLAAGSTTALSPNSAYAVAATVALAGYANTIGSLTGAGTVNLGGATLTVGTDNTSPAAFSGALTSAVGGALVKVGTGTLALSGSGSTYGGGTVVNGGTLLAANAVSSTGTGSVVVNAGGTLGGSGAIAGDVTLAGGTIMAGTPAATGTLTTRGTHTWASGTYAWRINDATGTAGAPGGWDLLRFGGLDVSTITGAFTIKVSGTPANFVAEIPGTPVVYTWTIASAAAPGGITNFDAARFALDLSAFAPAVPADRFNLGTDPAAQSLTLSYVAVPEPGVLAMAGVAGVAGLAALARGSRRRAARRRVRPWIAVGPEPDTVGSIPDRGNHAPGAARWTAAGLSPPRGSRCPACWAGRHPRWPPAKRSGSSSSGPALPGFPPRRRWPGMATPSSCSKRGRGSAAGSPPVPCGPTLPSTSARPGFTARRAIPSRPSPIRSASRWPRRCPIHRSSTARTARCWMRRQRPTWSRFAPASDARSPLRRPPSTPTSACRRRSRPACTGRNDRSPIRSPCVT